MIFLFHFPSYFRRPKYRGHAGCIAAAMTVVAVCLGSYGELPVELRPLEVSAHVINAGRTSGTTLIGGGEGFVGRSQTLSTILDSSPAVQVFDAGVKGFGDVYSIRGMANTPYFGPAAFTVYMDGIALARPFSFPHLLPSVESAVLLSGPQPESFGISGAGGVLVLETIPQEPSDRAHMMLSGGDYGKVSVNGGAGLRINENTDAGFGYDFAAEHGFVYNRQIEKRLGDVTQNSFDGYFRQQISPVWQLKVMGRFEAVDADAPPLIPANGPADVVYRAAEGMFETSNSVAAVALTGKVGNMPVQWISAEQIWELNPYESYMEIGFPLLSRITKKEVVRQHELSLDLLKDTSNWSLQIIAFHRAVEDKGSAERIVPGRGTVEASSYLHNLETNSLAGRLEYMASAQLTFYGGLRTGYEQHTYQRTETVPALSLINGKRRFDADYWKLGASWNVWQGITLDISCFSDGKPGGFSGFTGNPQFISFDAEQLRGGEAALIWFLLPDKFRMKITAYSYRIKDYHVERSFTQNDYFVVNAPDVSSRGLEGSMYYATDAGLSFDVKVSWNRAVFDLYDDPENAGVTYAGNRVPFASEWSAVLTVNADLPLGTYAGTLLRFQGEVFFSERNDDISHQKGYMINDVFLGWKGEGIFFEMRIQNLFNQEHNVYLNPELEHRVPGHPRRCMLVCGIEF